MILIICTLHNLPLARPKKPKAMTVIAEDLIVSTFYKRRIRCENLGNLKSYFVVLVALAIHVPS